MTENENKSKFSMILQALFSFRKDTEVSEKEFVINLLRISGSNFFTGESDEYALKFYNGRKMSKPLRDSFFDEEFRFNYGGAKDYLKDFISTKKFAINSIFSAFSISDKAGEKDINILLESIVELIARYAEYGEDHVSDTTRTIYRKKLIDRNNSLTVKERKELFFSLPNEEALLIRQYLQKLHNQLNKVKTVIDPTVDFKFYDIYVTNNVSYKQITNTAEGGKTFKEKKIEAADLATLIYKLDSNLIIEASGGFGKTMFIKHLAMDAINSYNEEFILPILLNARDYEGGNLEDFIIDTASNITNPPIDKETLRFLMFHGMCVVLIDGLDEMSPEYVNNFLKELKIYTNLNEQSHFFMTSRPSDNATPEGFSLVKLLPFSQLQSIQLIEKVDYDQEIKDKFLRLLKGRLFKTHMEFCENPLLLSIMFITYDKVGIPDRKHEFYRSVYIAMSERYSKISGRGSFTLHSKISPERMLDYIAIFSFRVQYDDKVSFTEEEIDYYLKDIRKNNPAYYETFTTSSFIKDLEKKLCLLYKDGLKYRFIHRSFQEYFCALHFSRQTDNKLFPIVKYLDEKKRQDNEIFVDKDGSVYFSFDFYDDNVLDLLYDINRERIEQHVFIPFLEELLSYKGTENEKFAYFVYKVFDKIEYAQGYCEDKAENLSKSDLFNLIAEEFVMSGDFREEFNIAPIREIDEFRKAYYHFVLDDAEDNSGHFEEVELWELEEDEEPSGSYYEVPMEKVIADPVKYNGFIEDLKSTTLYENYRESIDALKELKEKYAPPSGENLIELLK